MYLNVWGVLVQSCMVTFEKSSPGSGETCFRKLQRLQRSGEHAPRPPSNSRLWCSFCLPPHTHISSYGYVGMPTLLLVSTHQAKTQVIFTWPLPKAGQVLTLSLLRVINVKIPLQNHKKYDITQYGELDFTNSRYITHTIAFWKVGRIHFLTSGAKGLKYKGFAFTYYFVGERGGGVEGLRWWLVGSVHMNFSRHLGKASQDTHDTRHPRHKTPTVFQFCFSWPGATSATWIFLCNPTPSCRGALPCCWRLWSWMHHRVCRLNKHGIVEVKSKILLYLLPAEWMDRWIIA